MYSVDVSEHVITHEIGHTIGVCHTDGGGTGPGVGCIYIFGSPTTDPGSVFNSTFTSMATGEFSTGDVNALNALY